MGFAFVLKDSKDKYKDRDRDKDKDRDRDRGGRYASVTGYEGKVSSLVIPKEVKMSEGDFPVREISAHAFEGRDDIREVYIPESVTCLMPFAFSNCANLRHISLTDRIDDFRDGIIRQCPSLRLLEIRFFQEGIFQILKDLINDSDRMLSFHLYFAKDEVELVFPHYLDGFQEDTMARAIHEKIEGSGYAYRQTVSRRAIDFRAYDSLFIRARHEELLTAVLIAFHRLRYPYRLTDEHRGIYLDFLRENDATALCFFIKERNMGGIEFLIREDVVSEKALEQAIILSAELEFVECSAILMNYKKMKYSSGRIEEFLL